MTPFMLAYPTAMPSESILGSPILRMYQKFYASFCHHNREILSKAT